jgi:DNA mismatch repair protein MSH4
MSDKTIQQLVDDIRVEIPRLFRVCESISMLDMIAAFRFVLASLSLLGWHCANLIQIFTSQLVTTDDYARPHVGDCLAIKSGRHPVREKVGSKGIPHYTSWINALAGTPGDFRSQ